MNVFADKIRFEFYINREECSNISHSHNSKKEVESQHKSHTSWAVSYSIEKNIGIKSFLCDRESKLKFVPPSLSVQGQYLPKWEKDKSSNRHVNFSNLVIWSAMFFSKCKCVGSEYCPASREMIVPSCICCTRLLWHICNLFSGRRKIVVWFPNIEEPRSPGHNHVCEVYTYFDVLGVSVSPIILR